ncbi:MAG: hypothetical protein F6K50_07950 [Moorea sp. SIO3I7]|uniref:hypothetical protein n=1 Tax=Moorena sp. SIO3I8 TaxID=2607833 RepID=UPI0013C16BCB|nr:hypothetical protein [Moorena sp. SIO3I8]NEN95460.1 hypothetical protein [Moorena sp. SIO3I7]NEO06484.1 hypothetical protein [Moorena sp. SIO3I8]
MFRHSKYPLRPLITFCILVTLPYIFLLVTYFTFGEPPWINDIDWLKKLPNPSLILFLLEMLTLTLVVITFSIIQVTRILRERKLSRLNVVDWLIIGIILILTVVYAFVKIIADGDHPVIRLFYALFSAFIITFWIHNARHLLSKSQEKLLNILRKLDENPGNVFSYGRQLSSSINSTSLSVTWLLFPFLFWLPTLLSGLISPKDIAFSIGITFGILLFLLPVYAQIKLSNVLNASFKQLDEHIAGEIVKQPTNKADYERLKALVDLRETLTKSVKFSTQEFIVSIVQYSTIITALIAAAKI